MKPVVIKVFGDKSKKLEPEHHRIEFPGGSIAVDRTTDGEYWAHIAINRPERAEYPETHIGSKVGQVVGSRIDFDYGEYERRSKSGEPIIPELPAQESIEHVAVRFALTDLNH